jgi:predicted DNA-binding transcriptional regulator AlpA
MGDTRVKTADAVVAERLLTRPEAGGMLGVAPQTLANWRSMGRGPRCVIVGSRSIRYRLSDLIAYMAELETVEAVAA